MSDLSDFLIVKNSIVIQEQNHRAWLCFFIQNVKMRRTGVTPLQYKPSHTIRLKLDPVSVTKKNRNCAVKFESNEENRIRQ